ncbi:bifunctional DNA primase/polymerase [Ruegeria arenilitoris]|uniref:bifunctional DNA primase/polymerase n=1 Tax=Ruegeria arenilitoris TaxID=1173585 RepID=UPI00147C4311|nr:bifunctional DNA primase/polymerase [Ruegeria arenilitoris]
MIDVKKLAFATGLPTFPIRIYWDTSKHLGKGGWNKTPLKGTRGHKDAQWPQFIDRLDWHGANGFGIPMGATTGLYMLDADDYKDGGEADRWMDERKLPPTRTHKTVSGGRHFIYALSTRFKTLRSRNDIVPGLDSRGEGGWAAFGPGYEVIDSRMPAILPSEICEELMAGHSGIKQFVGVNSYSPPTDPTDIDQRLMRMLKRQPALARRWSGDDSGLVSGRSSLDLAVAQLLSMVGFSYDEIVWLLMQRFEHGQARHLATGGERAAQRCAQRAIDTREEERATARAILKRQETPLTESERAKMRALVRGAL